MTALMALRPTRRQRATALWLALGVVCSAAQPALAVDLLIAPSLQRAAGQVEVWVTLADPPLAEAQGANAKTRGAMLSVARRQAHLRSLDQKHERLSAAARGLGGEELGRVSRAHNAVALRIDAARLVDLADLPGVVAVRPVRTYELALSDTLPHIGAAAARAAGKDGTGARVAVLDSGIDYTHKNLGGPGTTAAYETAVSTFPNPYFPSAKVVGGFDFVGSKWPGAAGNSEPRTEDPNPIDDGPGGGHGTHVADIIAGRSLDGTRVGVAPGAELYAIKVCSSVINSCNGVALLKGVDFALDPDGDGSMRAVDVMNLSLGSAYGQKEDDLTEALNRAVSFGVVVVSIAGNAGDKPYVVSAPSVGPPIISVGSTEAPNARIVPLIVNSPAAIAGRYLDTAAPDWAPVDRAVTGDVAFVGRGCPAGSIEETSPADLYLADPSGKVALIDRGACDVSLKVDRAARSGAVAVVLGLVAGGDPFAFGLGGGTSFVPTLVITQADASRIKNSLQPGPVNVTISPANAIPLVGSVARVSSRGPSMSFNAIKPEIGAPSALFSAHFGTGDGQVRFSGSSAASAVVAGSAAILVGAIRGIEPLEVKARLMNTAETETFQSPAVLPGQPAPIGRIGAGEVRVDRALSASSAAWVVDASSAALSFGYHAVSGTASFERTVQVRNYGRRPRSYTVAVSFRDPGKAGGGAVEVRAPKNVFVGARGQVGFKVEIVVHPEKLPVWTINGGSQGGNGTLLGSLEMDGYLTLTAGSEKLSLPWHVLLHRAADLHAGDAVAAGGALDVVNVGVADGVVEAFSLTGRSEEIPASALPRPGDNRAVVDLRAVGVRLVSPTTIQFGISTWGARAHPNYPAAFLVYIDADRDGNPDYLVLNNESGGFAATGQNVVEVVDVNDDRSVVAFADADLNSSNVIFTVPLAAVGLTADTQFDFRVVAADNYFTPVLHATDAIETMTYTPSRPRFATERQIVVPPHGVGTLNVTGVAGGAQASPSQTGLLLLYRHSDPRRESQIVTVED